MTTIHNFVDVEYFNQSFSSGDHFIYIGRNERLKGIFTLLQAFKNLPTYKLLIVGTGEAEDEAKSFIQNHNLSNVEMMGFKQDNELFNLVEKAIASIIPSEWYENCPLSAAKIFSYPKIVL